MVKISKRFLGCLEQFLCQEPIAAGSNSISMSEDFDKDGMLYRRNGKKWSTVYAVLIGGTFHFYSSEEDSKPKASIDVATYDTNITKENGNFLRNSKDKDSPMIEETNLICFRSEKGKIPEVFSCNDDEEYNGWIAKIKENMGKEQKPPLKKDKKLSRMQRAKKNVAGRASNSALGKKMIRENVPDEVRELIAAIKKIIDLESGNTKKGQEMEEIIYKFGTKIYFLANSGVIKVEELGKIDKPINTACEVYIKCFDIVKYSSGLGFEEDRLKESLLTIMTSAYEIIGVFNDVLGPHLKSRNMAKMRDIILHISHTDRLLRFLTLPNLQNEGTELKWCLLKYLSKHGSVPGSQPIVEH
ncbi:hypothetical protein PROFUN_14624 [Planoprotostelium fungivorum]|uniref:PH domain-containing protein n=1 Tax=Planoprotostelium fungivorum TaxID=1890364 RepID=A0A2P6N936_9EUKA|nr:hypothetical protein PROFUN_14624 [Planoprotostelium fungivorum]